MPSESTVSISIDRPAIRGLSVSVVQGYFNYYAVPGIPRKSGGVSGSGAGAPVANYSSPEPETPDLMDAHPRVGSTMVSSTASTPSPFLMLASPLVIRDKNRMR
jgi:hypothetical protein